MERTTTLNENQEYYQEMRNLIQEILEEDISYQKRQDLQDLIEAIFKYAEQKKLNFRYLVEMLKFFL